MIDGGALKIQALSSGCNLTTMISLPGPPSSAIFSANPGCNEVGIINTPIMNIVHPFQEQCLQFPIDSLMKIHLELSH